MSIARPLNARHPRSLSISITEPYGGGQFTLACPPMAITIARIWYRNAGSIMGTTFYHGPDPSAGVAGTEIQSEINVFNNTFLSVVPDGDASIPADDYIWASIAGIIGNSDRVEYTLELE